MDLRSERDDLLGRGGSCSVVTPKNGKQEFSQTKTSAPKNWAITKGVEISPQQISIGLAHNSTATAEHPPTLQQHANKPESSAGVRAARKRR